MMSEALGGWFAFGAADRIRSSMERVFARMRPAALADSVTARSDASVTLSEILLAAPPKLDTLIAHSKGSLVLAHALQSYVDDLEGDDSPLYKHLRIVTLGAVVGVPAEFMHVKQYLGAYDWFGGANSSLGVVHERVPGLSYYLRSWLPLSYERCPAVEWGRRTLHGSWRSLSPQVTFPPMPIPVEVPKVARPAPAAAKAKEPVRKPAKKMTKPVGQRRRAARRTEGRAPPAPRYS